MTLVTNTISRPLRFFDEGQGATAILLLPSPRRCTKCNRCLPPSFFYRCKQAVDGVAWMCSECKTGKKYGLASIGRSGGKGGPRLPGGEAVKRRRRAQNKYLRNNPEKALAHRDVFAAINEGRLTPKPCEICGGQGVAHHDDYLRTLDVRWVCRSHHTKLHMGSLCLMPRGFYGEGGVAKHAPLTEMIRLEDHPEFVAWQIDYERRRRFAAEDLEETAIAMERVRECLSRLTYREREVIKMLYGLNDGIGCTLREVGIVFKISRERVRQIAAKGVRRLRVFVEAVS